MNKIRKVKKSNNATHLKQDTKSQCEMFRLFSPCRFSSTQRVWIPHTVCVFFFTHGACRQEEKRVDKKRSVVWGLAWSVRCLVWCGVVWFGLEFWCGVELGGVGWVGDALLSPSSPYGVVLLSFSSLENGAVLSLPLFGWWCFSLLFPLVVVRSP